MRRFVQTFVLAPQTAKKYYVHSDIFRYQDIYFPNATNDNGDNDADGEYAEGTSALVSIIQFLLFCLVWLSQLGPDNFIGSGSRLSGRS